MVSKVMGNFKILNYELPKSFVKPLLFSDFYSISKLFRFIPFIKSPEDRCLMLLTIKEAADVLRYDQQTIYGWVNKNVLPGVVRIGTRGRGIRIDEGVLRDFVASGGTKGINNVSVVSRGSIRSELRYDHKPKVDQMGFRKTDDPDDFMPQHATGNWKAKEGVRNPHCRPVDRSSDQYEMMEENELVSKAKGSNDSPEPALEGSFREGRI